MSAKKLFLSRVHGPRQVVLFDVATGQTAPADPTDAVIQGNFSIVEGHTCAVYVDDHVLFFQMGAERWPLAEPATKVRYRHDFNAHTTVFTIDGKSIEYPAWWIGDPLFEPPVPERDEEEDYLAYVCEVHRNRSLQASLVEAWSHR